jgi:8-amino-7-oxononanoate synthase
MGTLGKAAGLFGAFVAAHPLVVDTLVQTARSYVFTTAVPPFIAAALEKSVAIIRDDHARRAHLFALVARFRERMRPLPWTLPESFTPIQPIVVGGNSAALELAGELWRRGLWVPAIRPPTVPKGTARLRVSLSAAHRLADVDVLVEALAELAPQFAAEFADRGQRRREASTAEGDRIE